MMLTQEVQKQEQVSLQTGAIVVLTGEYLASHPALTTEKIADQPVEQVEELVFLSNGTSAPYVDGEWVLVEPFDSWG